MRHVSLTCKNHPNLRWSCKEIAVNANGTYNGARNIFFNGEYAGELYSDKSGSKCNPAIECDCPPNCLTFAPEDEQIRLAHESRQVCV